MDEIRIEVIGEDEGNVGGENKVELIIGNEMRVMMRRLKKNEVKKIKKENEKMRKGMEKKIKRGKSLNGRKIEREGNEDIRIKKVLSKRKLKYEEK